MKGEAKSLSWSMKVQDKSYLTTSLIAQRWSFICDKPLASAIPNHANCKLEDQMDFVNFTLPYVTNESCFK